jgi:predicted DNA-binding protein with PD1-like motif
MPSTPPPSLPAGASWASFWSADCTTSGRLQVDDTMQSKLLHESDGLRTFAVVFAIGDEPVEGLRLFAREHRVTGAQVTAIGAFSRAVVAYFDWATRAYERIAIDEQVEVLVLAGNLALKDGDAALHAHVVLGPRNSTTRGGHLLEAAVRPTLEVTVTGERGSPPAADRRGDRAAAARRDALTVLAGPRVAS